MKTLISLKANNVKNKKIFLFLCIQLCIILFLCFSPFSASADSNERAEEKLQENVLEQLDELDLQALQDYVDSLTDIPVQDVSQRLLAYVKGDAFDYRNFLTSIADVLFEKVRAVFPAFACIAAITLLSGLISTLRSGSNMQTTGEMIFLISYVAALIPLLSVLITCFEETFSCIFSLQRQMQAVFPIMITLMAASGGGVTAAICRPGVAFFSTSIVSVLTGVVLPITVTIIVFSLAANLTKELKISKFSQFFKSINKWIIGVCISVFGLFFTLQGIGAATYDGVVRRAAKYAIGNGIPIVGGFLSGGFDLAVAGSVLIKNSLGNMSIFLMVYVLFEPLILLVSVNILLRFTAAVTQPFGDSRISDFLGETADNLQYCSAALLFTAFLYFLCVLLLVTVSEALF